MKNLSPYQCYRSMSWTSDNDECETECGTIMDESHYVAGRFGHYCSDKCLAKEEYGPDSSSVYADAMTERRMMGITE